MEVFGELENNMEAILEEKTPKTVMKNLRLSEGNNSSDSDDDYELHQSRLDQEQFELKDDVADIEAPARLVSAIQKVKERIKQQQLEKKKLSEVGSGVTNMFIETQSLPDKTFYLLKTDNGNNAQKITDETIQPVTVRAGAQKTSLNIDEVIDNQPVCLTATEIMTGNTQKTTQSTQKLIAQEIYSTQHIITQKTTQHIDATLEGEIDLIKSKNDTKFQKDCNNEKLPKINKKNCFTVERENEETANETFILTNKVENTATEYNDSFVDEEETISQQNENHHKASATTMMTMEHSGANDDDEDDADEAIVCPTRNRVGSFKLSMNDEEDENDENNPNRRNTNLVSLFLSEEEDVVDEALDEEEKDDISKNIEDYENMSKEQRYLARKIERSKLRREKRKVASGSDVIPRKFSEQAIGDHSVEFNKHQVVVKKEKLRTHVILKKANEDIKILTEHEYSKDKLLKQLQLDSDSGEERELNKYGEQLTIQSLKSKSNIKPLRKLLKNNEICGSEIIELSESEDDEENDSFGLSADISMVQKAKKLELSLKYSKKKKQKMDKVQKLSFTDRIQRMKAKELKDKLSFNTTESRSSKTTFTDADLAKMLLQDQLNNSSRAKKKLRQQRRLEKQQQLLKEGKLTHDDDDPEFSSDYDISDESEDYGSGEEETDQGRYDKEAVDDKIQHSAAKLFDTSGKLEEFNFTLTNMSEKVRTQDKSFDGLTDAEKFARLKHIAEVDEQSELVDSTTDIQPSFRNGSIADLTIENHSANETSNFQLHDILDSQNLVLETQADGVEMSTQKLENDSAALSASTQPLDSFVSNEPKNSETLSKLVHEDGSLGDDTDEDEDEKIQIKRKKTDRLKDTDYEDVEGTVEDWQKQAELIKLAKKMQRDKTRKLEAEFKAKGLGDIVEKEAVESEDEFYGVGGGDRDFSDEENSEDEKMIDDATNANIGEDEIRKLHLDKELEEDQARVAKTYKDVKTHELGKRRAKNGVFDVSDSEDDEIDDKRRMMEFIRKRRLREEKDLHANNDFKLAENDPKKAFYDEISIKLPSHVSLYKDSFSNSPTDLDTNDDDESVRNSDLMNYYNGLETTQRPALKKPKTSTLTSTLDDDIMYGSFHDQETNRMKAEVLSDNPDDDDNDGSKILKLLKKKTSLKLTRKLVVPAPQAKETTDELNDSGSFGLLTKTNSITSSFKRSTEKKIKISANTGNVIREVSVTTSSKSVGNSKAAVTSFNSSSSIKKTDKRKIVRGSGLDRLDRMLAKSREKGIKSIGKR
ncbi:hypothetical protein CANINC_003764 [Pichia inconspicua]|uniref:DNA replication checkpoint mediator MRC1 domain-containing protein n=1 Tax=Pichia inconspicua TaxID=52247 RepID=A0A4T0WXT6_9ASCO|nr:hypothetical protein CANINC_003764 [[Candida] inconspicua]